MTVSRSTTYLAVLFVVAIGALAGASWWAYDVQQRVLRAQDTLFDCRRLAGQILARREAPETAADNRTGEDELAKRFEAWSRGAGLDANQVERIDPVSPRRPGDTDYLIEGADIELARVTLPQLAELAQSIAREDPRLRVSRLRLTSPRSATEEGQERWRVELALTYLRHSPKSSRRR